MMRGVTHCSHQGHENWEPRRLTQMGGRVSPPLFYCLLLSLQEPIVSRRCYGFEGLSVVSVPYAETRGFLQLWARHVRVIPDSLFWLKRGVDGRELGDHVQPSSVM